MTLALTPLPSYSDQGGSDKPTSNLLWLGFVSCLKPFAYQQIITTKKARPQKLYGLKVHTPSKGLVEVSYSRCTCLGVKTGLIAKTKMCNKCACLTVGNLPPLSPSFSAADTDHRILQVTVVRDLGVPLDTTFRASAHCIEAANTARRLLFMVRRSFCKLSKTAFTPLYCALMRPHLEYAMGANAPTLRADINQLERVQRLATRLVRGLRHVQYEERLRQPNLNADASELISSWPSKFSK